MYKKLLSIAIALAMLMSFAACGAKEEAPAETPKTEAPATTEAPKTEAPATAEAPVTAEAPAEEKKEEEPWVWDGEKYDDIYKNLGKADITVTDPTGVLKSVLDKGVLVIGTSPDYPAAEFVDLMSGDIKGCEILLAKYIANSLGVDLKIEAMDFGTILAAADTGKVDLAISGYGYKADRAEQYELSHGYQATSSASHHTIVVPADKLDQYNSLADFNGKKIDAQANSLQQMYVEDQIENADLALVSSLDQAIMELIAGKVDAVALDSTTARNYAEQSDGKIVSVFVEKGIEFDLSLYSDYAGNVCAVKKGETQFMDVINEIIDDVIENGYYTTWYYAACDAAGIVPGDD